MTAESPAGRSAALAPVAPAAIVRAAGGCTVRLGAHTCRATSPALVTWADDRALVASAFNPLLRTGFRVLGIRQFIRLRAVPAG